LSADAILADLSLVEAERHRRSADAELSAAVVAVKEYQQRRFARSYESLLASARYGPAARFFLDELYGPRDFAERDHQFARVVPALVRLFPSEVVDTVASLARLHAISERLDSAVALRLLKATPIDAAGYVAAWRQVGDPEAREQQVALTLRIGAELDRLTRKPLLRQTLRVMRGPAHAAGLGALQGFLERGFDTFRAMKGASEFLTDVGRNERALCDALFGVGDEKLLGQLP
jgi:hypothetical protein